MTEETRKRIDDLDNVVCAAEAAKAIDLGQLREWALDAEDLDGSADHLWTLLGDIETAIECGGLGVVGDIPAIDPSGLEAVTLAWEKANECARDAESALGAWHDARRVLEARLGTLAGHMRPFAEAMPARGAAAQAALNAIDEAEAEADENEPDGRIA